MSTVLNRNLFDQWTVVRNWGSTKSGQGGGRLSVVENFEAGLALLQTIARRREKLSYRVVA